MKELWNWLSGLEWGGSGWDVLASVGTLAAVIVALFYEGFKSLIWKPRLRISMQSKRPEMELRSLATGTMTSVIGERETTSTHYEPAWYFRIWVANKGNERAEEVEVFAANLVRVENDGTLRDVARFFPMNLTWSHFVSVQVDGISSRLGRYCDLGFILEPQWGGSKKQKEYVKDARFRLCYHVDPGKEYGLDPGRYRVTIELSAANSANPARAEVDFSFTGKWFEERAKMLSNDGIQFHVRML